MCATVIVIVDGRVGAFSFSTGVKFQREQTLLEWAKNDFDACINYLLSNGKEDEAEIVFEQLVRITIPRSR